MVFIPNKEQIKLMFDGNPKAQLRSTEDKIFFTKGKTTREKNISKKGYSNVLKARSDMTYNDDKPVIKTDLKLRKGLKDKEKKAIKKDVIAKLNKQIEGGRFINQAAADAFKGDMSGVGMSINLDSDSDDEMEGTGIKTYSNVLKHLIEHITDAKEPIDKRDFKQAKEIIDAIKNSKIKGKGGGASIPINEEFELYEMQRLSKLVSKERKNELLNLYKRLSKSEFELILKSKRIPEEELSYLYLLSLLDVKISPYSSDDEDEINGRGGKPSKIKPISIEKYIRENDKYAFKDFMESLKPQEPGPFKNINQNPKRGRGGKPSKIYTEFNPKTYKIPDEGKIKEKKEKFLKEAKLSPQRMREIDNMINLGFENQVIDMAYREHELGNSSLMKYIYSK